MEFLTQSLKSAFKLGNEKIELCFSYSCDRPEQVIPIKKGTLQKQTKSAEEKAKELQDEIRKKREKLSQVEV